MGKGVWRTIKGRHIFIEDGEDIKDAVKRVREGNSNIKKKTSEKQEDEDYKLYKQARENPESIDPMTENSTDWEALDRKYANRYSMEKGNEDFVVKGTPKAVSPKEELARIREYDPEYNDDDFTHQTLTKNGVTYNITEHKEEGYYKGKAANGRSFIEKSTEKYKIENPNDASDWGWIEKEEYDRLTSKPTGFENEDRSYAGWELYSDDPNRFKTSNQGQRVINSRENNIQGSNIDRTDAVKLQMGHGISNEKMIGYANRYKTARRAANSSIQKDEVAIATKIRKGNMNKDENTINDTYFLGDEKKGYYVQFQDVEKRKYEDVNKYPHVSPKKESMTWARVWKDGENIYNKEHNKYEARAEVAKFLEGRSLKSQSQLIQSYIDRGYSKETAKKMAMKAIKIRKGK